MNSRTPPTHFSSYKNFISLGHFCGVAYDLGRLGLRAQSSPFDWVISSLPGVIQAIRDEFADFLDLEHLSQNTEDRSHYHEEKYDLYFFHDFSRYEPLEAQHGAVKAKYERRIERFLRAIKEPTLFVRYIASDKTDPSGKPLELKWIEQNLPLIKSVLKKYNPENEIIFLGDETVNSNLIQIFHASRGGNEQTPGSPIYQNPELLTQLSAIDFPDREKNQTFFLSQEKKKRSLPVKLKNKFSRAFNRMFSKEYHHSKTYSLVGK